MPEASKGLVHQGGNVPGITGVQGPVLGIKEHQTKMPHGTPPAAPAVREDMCSPKP